MVWKMDSWYAPSPMPVYEPPQPVQRPQPLQQGTVIAHVGQVREKKVSRRRDTEHTERIIRIDDDVLGYNIDGQRVFVRCADNDPGFDLYIALPFVKGVTERETGRTMVIIGSNAHHGEAMQNQFPSVIWDEKEELRQYGNSIRWINVGDTSQGFIGLDYAPAAAQTQGVARSIDDVRFLAQTLLSIGYDPKKRMFLLKPPHIVEREEGKKFREQGIHTLEDYIRINEIVR